MCTHPLIECIGDDGITRDYLAFEVVTALSSSRSILSPSTIHFFRSPGLFPVIRNV